MFNSEIHKQTTLDFAQGGYLSIAAESFITDRKAASLAKRTIKFYQNYLKAFLKYCEGLAVSHVQDISADFIRRYLLSLEGEHNSGGMQAPHVTNADLENELISAANEFLK